MAKYHVHVYKTPEVLELDVEADDREAALSRGVRIARTSQGTAWKEPPKKYIAVMFEEDKDAS